MTEQKTGPLEAEAKAAAEREALAQVVSRFGYKGYPSNGDYEEADAILAAGFHRHPQPTESEPSFTDVLADTPAPEGCPGIGVQPTEGEPTEAAIDAALKAAENAGPLTPIRERLRAALRAAMGVVADQGGGER